MGSKAQGVAKGADQAAESPLVCAPENRHATHVLCGSGERHVEKRAFRPASEPEVFIRCVFAGYRGTDHPGDGMADGAGAASWYPSPATDCSEAAGSHRKKQHGCHYRPEGYGGRDGL